MGVAAAFGLALSLGVAPAPASADEELVDVRALVPDLSLDLRYATADNFLHRVVYPPGSRCLLRKSVAERLAKVATALRPQGLKLRVFDCYRPHAVQEQMWKIFPHKGYVADPAQGSHHNRGTAVDLTLEDADGKPLQMPTEFDSFQHAAHARDTSSPPAAQANRARLLEAMEAQGFTVNPMEWWHYDAPHAARAPIADVPLTEAK